MALLSGSLGVLLSLLSGVIALGADRHPWLLKRLAFPLLGLSGLASAASGVGALLAPAPSRLILPLGLPWLPWALRLDALSGLFLLVIGVVLVAVALYGPGYVREFQHGRNSLAALGFFTGLFVAGMQLVVLADDAFLFMVAWELMSLSSYFLVTFQHEQAANRRAGFLYLLMAHVGGLSILLCYGVLAAHAGGFSFELMRHTHPDTLWAGVAFVLALVGFGMKAGLVPLHGWLPEAHPVAPSHVSALMSGVMLKVAVYGLLRVTLDLLGPIQWGWGVTVLLLGAVTAVVGVLHALVQTDLKRLLAYSSVENMGIVFLALGLALLFFGTGHPLLGRLALVAALYHVCNHALFKSLLFLGAGAVLQHSHERDLERMGGLLKRMPYTGLFFLVGSLSIASLPPFNGFVSEWLTFQAALQGAVLHSGVLRILIPVAAAALALTAALAAATFVKAYGIAFLGRARGRRVRHARETTFGMRAAQGALALLCLALGLLPVPMIRLLAAVPRQLFGAGLPQATAHGWLWLTPVNGATASYSAPLVWVGIALAWLVSYLLLHPRGQRAVRRDAPWDCGFGPLSPRMQYSAGGFSQPARRIFRPLWLHGEQTETTREGLRTTALRHQFQIGDRALPQLYAPLGRAVLAGARRIARLQSGNIRTYLAYSFFTLLLLLWLIS